MSCSSSDAAAVVLWTFPVPRSDALVIAPPDWEGLLFLNGPAAAIWKEAGQPDLQALRPAAEPSPPAAAPRLLPVPSSQLLLQIGAVPFCVRVPDGDLVRELWPRLLPLKTPENDRPADHELCITEYAGGFALYRNGTCFGTAPFAAGARAVLLQELTRLAAPHRESLVTMHAGAVGNAERCFILAGTSYSGKSTLCAALLQSGLICYADDSAVLTPDFQLCGMPFPISLRESSWPLFPHLDKPRFLPSNLNGASPLVEPAGIIFVDYQPEAGPATLATLAVFDALVALQQCGFGVDHNQGAITAFLEWVSSVPSYHMMYSDLPSAVGVVQGLLHN